MSGTFTATYGVNYSTVTLNLDAIYNDSFVTTTGTLRLSYWALTYVPVRGTGITGYRLATFSTLSPLAPRMYYSGIVRSSSMLTPPNGTYWLVVALEEYDPVNCSSTDGYCIEDSFVSNEQRTFGPVTLSIAKSGSGSGTVTSSPAGISCGANCSAQFTAGSAITLSAAPSGGSSFAGWSGGGCGGTGSCSISMNLAQTVTATFNSTASNPPRLANISTRNQVLTGNHVLIGGFIIGGSTPKTVVVRARGPSLVPLGLPNALSDPVLALYSGQTVIASNDDWYLAANSSALQSSGFAPASSRESAILVTLNPGAYTAIVSGYLGATGIGIIEVFEVDAVATPLINISTRGQVLTGDNVMIGGFIIQGSGPKTVVVRARGPSLSALGLPGALQDPILQLYSGQTMIASNDDFVEAANLAQLQASGFAPSNALESAILITLNPGAYTAIVSGYLGGTGVGIIEVFTVP